MSAFLRLTWSITVWELHRPPCSAADPSSSSPSSAPAAHVSSSDSNKVYMMSFTYLWRSTRSAGLCMATRTYSDSVGFKEMELSCVMRSSPCWFTTSSRSSPPATGRHSILASSRGKKRAHTPEPCLSSGCAFASLTSEEDAITFPASSSMCSSASCSDACVRRSFFPRPILSARATLIPRRAAGWGCMCDRFHDDSCSVAQRKLVTCLSQLLRFTWSTVRTPGTGRCPSHTLKRPMMNRRRIPPT